MSNDIDLATALFGNKRLENGTSESVKIMTGTAVSDSSDGKVKVIIDGVTTGEEYDGELQDNVIELDTSPNVMNGDVVQITCYGGISKNMMVTSVLNSGDRTQDTADLAQYCADEAAKVATNFIAKGDNSITLGDFNKSIGRTIGALILNTNGASVSIQGTTTEISLDGHKHSVSDVTSGTLPVSQGGTGKTSGTFYGETVLFNNASQAMSGGITLSQACTGFTYLDVYCKDNDGMYAYTKVYQPTVGKIFRVTSMNGDGSNYWIRHKAFRINSATDIDTSTNSSTSFDTGILANGSHHEGDYINIVRVVGIK